MIPYHATQLTYRYRHSFLLMNDSYFPSCIVMCMIDDGVAIKVPIAMCISVRRFKWFRSWFYRRSRCHSISWSKEWKVIHICAHVKCAVMLGMPWWIDWMINEWMKIDSRNFAFKCHRQGTETNQQVFAVNSLCFHPRHGTHTYSIAIICISISISNVWYALLCLLIGTFATAGSDGCFTFWDKDTKQRLKLFPRNDNSITSVWYMIIHDTHAIAIVIDSLIDYHMWCVWNVTNAMIIVSFQSWWYSICICIIIWLEQRNGRIW